MNKMVILETKLHKNRISVHKILIFVVKMCNNGLSVLEAKFSCGGHQTFSAGMVKRGVLVGRWGFLTRDMEDRFIPDVMNDVYLPIRRYPENLVLISQLEVCQEGGVKKRGTWRTVRVPNRRYGGQGHS